MKHLAQLAENLQDLGPPGKEALGAMSAYLELLLQWTDRVDLVSPGSAEELIQRHVRDAFACWRLLDERGLFDSGNCLDVGSGAGLPGLVFAMLAPGCEFFLCEPRQKRVVFLQEVRRRARRVPNLGPARDLGIAARDAAARMRASAAL